MHLITYHPGDIVDFEARGLHRGQIIRCHSPSYECTHGRYSIRHLSSLAPDGSRTAFPGQRDFTYRPGALFGIEAREVWGLAPLVDAAWLLAPASDVRRAAA